MRNIYIPILHTREMRFKGETPWPRSHAVGSAGQVCSHVGLTPRPPSTPPCSLLSTDFPHFTVMKVMRENVSRGDRSSSPTVSQHGAPIPWGNDTVPAQCTATCQAL